MPKITFEGTPYDCNAGETVLECLSRHDVLLPSGCRSGSCHSCRVKAIQGTPPSESQVGLKETLKAQNNFLACICKPTEDLEIALDSAVVQYTATVMEKSDLNASVVRFKLSKPEGFVFQAGQFINLIRPTDQLSRSYSIASIEGDGFLELHVRRVPDGQMSNWLSDHLIEGDEIAFSGPAGDCFYLQDNIEQPLLLAGAGTGLAPLYGIARQAIQSGHRGKIQLFHASFNPEGLYYMDALHQLAAEHPQLTYTACVLHGEAPAGGVQGEVDKAVVATLGELNGYRAFLCGDPPVIEKMQRSFFMAGISMQEIYADAFTYTP